MQRGQFDLAGIDPQSLEQLLHRHIAHAPALALGAGATGGNQGLQVSADGGSVEAGGGLGFGVGEVAFFAEQGGKSQRRIVTGRDRRGSLPGAPGSSPARGSLGRVCGTHLVSDVISLGHHRPGWCPALPGGAGEFSVSANPRRLDSSALPSYLPRHVHHTQSKIPWQPKHRRGDAPGCRLGEKRADPGCLCTSGGAV